jgi:hypothetical protein
MTDSYLYVMTFFYWYHGGGVQLGPLGTAATNRPIVPAPSDYDDGEIGGMMICRGNRSIQRKHAPVPLCPQTPHACPDANLGHCGGKPLTNRLSYGTACYGFFLHSWDETSISVFMYGSTSLLASIRPSVFFFMNLCYPPVN